MKKIISFICAVLIAASAFSFAVCASEPQVSFSDDFGTLTYEGIKYTAIDSDIIRIDTYRDDYDVTLTAEQLKTVSELSLFVYEDNSFIQAEYELKSGASVTCTYVSADYKEAYELSLNRDVIDVSLNAGTMGVTSEMLNLPKLMQNKTTISYNNALNEVEDWYYVKSHFVPEQAYMFIGVIIIDDDKYYYLDFNAANIDYADNFYLSEIDDKELVGFEVTDSEQIEIIANFVNDYWGDDEYGSIFGDDLASRIISNIMLLLVFGLLPSLALIALVVLGIFAKGKYKKMLFALAGVTAVELVIFAVLFILLI